MVTEKIQYHVLSCIFSTLIFGGIYDKTDACITFTVIEYQLFVIYCLVDTLRGPVKITLEECGNGRGGGGGGMKLL